MTEGRVLVVEDEEIVRSSMVRVLQRAGLDTEGVPSGEEALTRMDDRHYDILLADIRLPGMSGLECLEQAKSRDPRVGAMLISGYGTLANAIAALDLGIQGFILKPVAPQELVRRVTGGIDRARAERETYRTGALGPLAGIGSRLASEGSLEQALLEAARVAGEECNAHHVSIHLLDEAGNLHLAASWGAHPDAESTAVEQEESPRGWVMRRRERLLLGEGSSWNAAAGVGGRPLEQGIASALHLPIAIRGNAVGVLTVLKGPDSPQFSEGDEAFLSLVCNLLALAAESPRL